MSQVCSNCRGSRFEEIDDQLHCATPGCGIRIGGQKTVSESVFQGTGTRLTQEVKSSSQRVQKITGSRWNTYQAFNLILKAQTDFLINECGAPERLRLVVLGLWSMFLTKSEVAFIDDSTGNPRLPLMSRKRDVALMVREVDSVPNFKVPKSKKRTCTKPHFRLGSTIAVKRRPDDAEEEDLVQEEHKDEQLTCSAVDASPTVEDLIDMERQSETTPFSPVHMTHDLSDSTERDLENIQLMITPHLKDGTLEADILVPDDTGIEAMEESVDEHETRKGKRKSQPKVRKPRKPKEKPPPKPLPFKLTDEEMNSRSHDIGYTVAEKHPRHRLRDEYTDYMDLRTSLSFLFIACRLIGHGIYVTDLIQWVDQGFLTYFDATRLFPDDWFLQAGDHQTFCLNSSPFPEAILYRSSNLVKFLSIPDLPSVDMFRLIERFLVEMDLPVGISHAIRSDTEIAEVVRSFGEPRMRGRALVFRFHELHAIAVIIIAMRKIFGTGSQMMAMCDKIRKVDGSSDLFCFDEWIEATKLRVGILKHNYIPLYGNCESQVDASLVADFHRQVVSNWRFRSNGVSVSEANYDENLVKIFDRLDVSSNKTEFPPPSQRFLVNALTFAGNRVKRNPFLTHILSLEFRNKRLDYLKLGSKFTHQNYTLLTPRGSIEWDELLAKSPVELQVMLQLASWILHMSPVHLLPELKRVEKQLFPERYPNLTNGAKNNNKRRRTR